jgi:flagellar capping protein FliD
MITIISALGALIIGVLITLVVCHFLPKEKIRTANQELEKKENETQLRIKDLEKEYIEKRNELENQYNELNEQYYQDIQKQDKELHDSAAR